MIAPMRLPEPRGPLTSALCTDLTSGTLAAATRDPEVIRVFLGGGHHG